MSDDKHWSDKGQHIERFNEEATKSEPSIVDLPNKKEIDEPAFDLSEGPKPPPGCEYEVKRQVRREDPPGVSGLEFAKFIQDKYTEMIDEKDNSYRGIDEQGDEDL